MANSTGIGLLRVSTPAQQLGLIGQRAEIERFAAEHGIDVLSFHTEIISGGAPFEERTGLQAAVEDIARYRADHLLVSKRDRFSRDPLVCMLTERALEKLDATVLAADGHNDQDATSELVRGILDCVARFERRMIGIRTKAALAALKAQGKSIGRPAGRVDDKPRKQRSDKGVIKGPRKVAVTLLS